MISCTSTCPTFDLKDLKKDVAKTVMLAALDPEKDPCDGVGNKNSNGFTVGEYDWNYDVG